MKRELNFKNPRPLGRGGFSLSMLGHDEIEINFARTKNDIADYENLIAQIQQQAQLILQDNATIKNTFEKFIRIRIKNFDAAGFTGFSN